MRHRMSSASSSLLSDPSAAVDQAVAVGVEGIEHASSRATQEQPALHMVGQWRSTEVAGSGAARKRRRRMDRVEHDLSDEHWTALKAEWGVCAYCGATDQPLQRDCVLALSRGGATRSTTSPACGSCNAARATTKSRAGCGASGSMSAPSWCTTSRSRRRSRCGSPPCQTSKRRRGKQPASHRSIQDRPDSAPVGRARRPGRGT
jgi:hypothetical protein